ncbi:MAG: EamA family transporter [Clostridia bacterium]|nr:EamA family transporter [Clostridia bacterium]
MYYGIITLSVIMFGLQFLFNRQYERESGNDTASTFVFAFIYSIGGLIPLLIMNGFKFGTTLFTVLMALVTSLNSILYTFCSLKALARINLSLYSLFAMLGGMLLPFLVGIVFYSEPVTLGKILCVVIVTLALALTVNKGESSGGFWYYAGVFVLNGMSGVLSKLFQSAPFKKADAASYSVWIAIVTALLAAVVLIFIRKTVKKPNTKAVIYAAGYGVLNRMGNYLLLIALAVLPASVQYPFITGGVMIVSTIISAIIGQKPSKKEIISVILAFAGILVLVIV